MLPAIEHGVTQGRGDLAGRNEYHVCSDFLSSRLVHVALDQTKMVSVHYFLSTQHTLQLSDATWQSATREGTNAKCGLTTSTFSPLCQQRGQTLWVL